MKETGREEYKYKVYPTFRNIDKGPVSRYWLAIGFHTVDCIIGVVGLQSLVDQTWRHDHIRLLCFGFGGVAGLSVVFIIFLQWLLVETRSVSSNDAFGKTAAMVLIALGFVALLWSDWVLALIKQQVSGVPDGNNALIGWLYFVAKRLTMLST